MKKTIILTTVLLFSGITVGAQAQTSAAEQIASLQQHGAGTVNLQNGKELWYAKHGKRSCSLCHTSLPTQMGKHARTGKPIKPMALSKNPQRFTSAKKTAKWFKRNCKWTMGRVCTAQEKADILGWLSSQ